MECVSPIGGWNLKIYIGIKRCKQRGWSRTAVVYLHCITCSLQGTVYIPIAYAIQLLFNLKITHVSTMALIRTEPTHQIRSPNKDPEWQESVDDLFSSLIDADSFKFTHFGAERDDSGNAINVFDSHTSSNGTAIIKEEVTLDDFSWLQFPPFEEEHPKTYSHQIPIHLKSPRRASSSDNDPLDLVTGAQPDSHLATYETHPPTSPKGLASPHTKDRLPVPVIQNKNQGISGLAGSHPYCSLTGAAQTMATSSSSEYQRICTGRSDADDLENFMERRSYENIAEGLPGRVEVGAPHLNEVPPANIKANAYANGIEPPAPFASLRNDLRIPHTPISSPVFHPEPASHGSSHHHDSSFAFQNPPITQNSDPFNSLITPPQSEKMASANWGCAIDDQAITSSPAFGTHMGKAEPHWLSAASYAAGQPSPSFGNFGLRIQGLETSSDSSLMMQSEPSPCFTAPMVSAISTQSVAALSLAGEFSDALTSPPSVSASPVGNVQYPMSPVPVMSQCQQLSPPSQQLERQQQPMFYRHHQRYHTVDTPISISTIGSNNSRSSCSNIASSTRSHNHRRSKSSHHPRRKASSEKCISHDGPRSASINFQNFTPADSQKILTGVAPSGSSKTKARREKEAAEKRRKLSEATKKFFLEHGGDLEVLEKEGLLLIEDGV